MPRKATKAADNVLYKARMEAATWNDRFNSRDGASEMTGIDKTRLAHMELGTIIPYPEEVMILAELYNAPELTNYHCSRLCPIGKEYVEPIELKGMPIAVLQVLASIKDIPKAANTLLEIIADGVITQEEHVDMEEVLITLTLAGEQIKALELAYRKAVLDKGDKLK